MKLKIGTIITPDFQLAFRNLTGLVFPSMEENLSVARAYKIIREQIDAYDKTRRALLAEHGSTCEDGSYRLTVSTTKIVQKALTEIEANEVDLGMSPVILPKGANFCARDLFELEPLIAHTQAEPQNRPPEPVHGA